MTKRNVAKTRARTKPRTKTAENEPRARSTDSRSEGPVDSEIRRAARRAGMKALPKKLSPNDLRESVAQRLRDAELGAAFKAETGVDPEEVVELTPAPDPSDVLRTALAPHLIRATDLVAETLAGAYGDFNPDDLSEQLADINRNLWAMRWELELHSDEIGFLFGGASCR